MKTRRDDEPHYAVRSRSHPHTLLATISVEVLQSRRAVPENDKSDFFINDLPLNGRNFIQLATLGAGTLPSRRTAERDNFIANGARAVQNSYLLDGVDNKNRILGFDRSAAQIIQPVIDAIQEFKVQTSTFSAEFGQAAGGVVNVTLKSGTTQLHGRLFEFLRNAKLDATPYFPLYSASSQGIRGKGAKGQKGKRSKDGEMSK